MQPQVAAGARGHQVEACSSLHAGGGQILHALLLRRIGEMALELLERLGNLEGGVVLGVFSTRSLIFIGEAGESRDHGVMVFPLFRGEFF
jgi:hypothetical protein